ncbi:SLBB domain-containing protein [Marinilabilia rubra]|uniref:Capsule biosynthesis protein n=1 Tax=Marinilabilia rubra TaxID=2162893 RepID=A0A2U2B3N6_9BACT|nr:SLBB domain-containing protein [Marinilabilia rubra]PWD97676.1 capsule biosynthesis protein [Marinilabilia rubra]
MPTSELRKVLTSRLLFLFFISFLTITICGPVAAQQSSLVSRDLSTVKSEDISDEQLQAYIAKGKAQGLTEDEVVQMAVQRGLPASEASELRRRVKQLMQDSTSVKSTDIRSREGVEAKDDGARTETQEKSLEWLTPEGDNKVFGSRLFSRNDLSFEPSLSIPTPVNYVLGAGDEIIIDVWGAASNIHQLEVSPEGTVLLDNLGPVYVNGLTIEEARERLIGKLKSLYRGLRPGQADQTTFARISLGRVRTIQVSIIGEVSTPGNYALSSLSTVLNGLYKAGGPNEIGSYRDIEVIRNNKVVANFDLYDLLIGGDQTQNIRLRDQDMVKINPYSQRVEVEGQVKRPGIYELQEKEVLSDLLEFAGQFTDSAFTGNLKVYRNTPSEKKIITVSNQAFQSFSLKNGDRLNIGTILDRFTNRVTISGAVWRPGEYELEEGMTVKDLLKKAEGVRPDAFLSRAVINRLDENYDFSIVPFSVREVLDNNSAHDILLEREDHIEVKTLQEMRENYSVSIRGEVQEGGDFPFQEGMRLGDLIFKAQGFKEGASESRIEIYRRVNGEVSSGKRSSQMAESFIFEVPRNLALSDEDKNFELAPFDQVFVRRRPDYQVQKNVKIEGEVLYPGAYTLKNRRERISDLVARSGGLTDEAYLAGATLMREQEELERVETEIETGLGEVLIDPSEKESFIGINLEEILANPGSEDDLFLKPGDVIRIPSELQTVKVTGAVLRDTEIRHIKGKSLKYYINRSGGFAENALKKSAYVVYANGDVAAKKKVLFFNNYPSVEPGAEIIIPAKEKRERLSAGERISILSSIVSMAAIVTTAITRF